MKKVLNVLLAVGAVMSSTVAHAEYDGHIFDKTGREIQTGERVVGTICDYFDERRNADLIGNPERILQHFQKNLYGSNKIMAFYQEEVSRQWIVLHSPYVLAPEASVDSWTRTQEASFPEKVMGGLASFVMLTDMGSGTRGIRTYKACINIEGTFDNRSAFQKMKDYFNK